MRVFQFITLFLALTVACGCSHRRAQREPVAATLCDCATCRAEQSQMISVGAVPAERFQYSETSVVTSAPTLITDSVVTSTPTLTTIPSVTTTAPAATLEDSGFTMEMPAATKPSDISPEYASDPGDEVVTEPPFSSSESVEMDEAPQQFNVPEVKEIESPSNMLDLGGSNFSPVKQLPQQETTDNAFLPFNRDLFNAKSEASVPLPVERQPSVLIERVSEGSQLELDTVAPPAGSQFQLLLNEPSSNEFEIQDSIVSAPVAIEAEQPELVEPKVDLAEPQANTFEPTAKLAAPNFAASDRTLAAQPQPTETVVQGRLYEPPVVLHARPQRSQLATVPVRTPHVVQPASAQTPMQHQRITQDSQLDPVYGLPLNNQVQFNSLPAIVEPQPATAAEAQHLHVHIHHEYGDNPIGVQGPVAYQNGQPVSNVQVVYRDDNGRVIMAPPTPTGGVAATVPVGDQRTYYVPPKQILRLKAVSPINQPRHNPSVASIQMRDTVVHGGNHLLTKPDYQAQAVQTNHGLPGIDHEKLRKAFKESPSGNSLR